MAMRLLVVGQSVAGYSDAVCHVCSTGNIDAVVGRGAAGWGNACHGHDAGHDHHGFETAGLMSKRIIFGHFVSSFFWLKPIDADSSHPLIQACS